MISWLAMMCLGGWVLSWAVRWVVGLIRFLRRGE